MGDLVGLGNPGLGEQGEEVLLGMGVAGVVGHARSLAPMGLREARAA